MMLEAPRKVTTDHPDYLELCSMGLRITLDGVVQDNVVGYDVDAGVIDRFQLDDEGNLFRHDDSSLLLEKVRGVVAVSLPSVS